MTRATETIDAGTPAAETRRLGTIAVAGRATEVIDVQHALPGAPPTTATPSTETPGVPA